ncbi:MAG: hypothetical protein VW835_13795, partial [Rickettsiales bacterium]
MRDASEQQAFGVPEATASDHQKVRVRALRSRENLFDWIARPNCRFDILYRKFFRIPERACDNAFRQRFKNPGLGASLAYQGLRIAHPSGHSGQFLRDACA